jgi:hypothetical protein
MKKIVLIGLIVTAFVCHKQIKWIVFNIIPVKWCTSGMIYDSIKDLRHPTMYEYHRLQKYLSEGMRPRLSCLKDNESRVRKFRIIGKSSHERPLYEKVCVNCDENEMTNCLIVYASFNKGFPKGLKRLVDQVASSDFKGHILYRIGGWPNMEEGDLRLAHIPYAFKPCFFKEAKRLGYQKVLWLDTSIKPVISLNHIFQEIEKRGVFTLANGWTVGPFMNNDAAKALGVTLEEAFHIPSCSAGLFGIDFSNEKASKIFDLWYEKAHDAKPFFSARSDQNVLSVILHQMGFHDLFPPEMMVEVNQPISENTFFMIDRNFVHQ